MLTAPPARPALHLRAWLVWGTAAVFVIYNYIQQVVPGLITADLARDFHVNAGALGALAGLVHARDALGIG